MRPGRNNLIFGTTHCDPTTPTCVQSAPLVDRYIGSPFFHYDFRSEGLIGNSDGMPVPFDLTTYSLGSSDLPYVQYAADTAFWTMLTAVNINGMPASTDYWNQHEVLLFARDPVEIDETFRSFAQDRLIARGEDPSTVNPNDSGAVKAALADIFGPGGDWRLAWHNCQPSGGCGGLSDMPDSASLWYPPQEGWQTTDLSVPQVSLPVSAPVSPASFWGANVPTGPGAAPAPQDEGSIKAAKVINHGICSTSEAYIKPDGSGILEQLATQLPLAVATGLDAGENAEARWLNVAPFLDFTTDVEDAQLGGFFLNVNIQANIKIGGVYSGGGPNIYYHDAHRWRLFDGRLTTDAGDVLYSFADGTGGDCTRISADRLLTHGMDHALTTRDTFSTLSEAIWQIANEAQTFAGGSGDIIDTEACGTGNEDVTATGPTCHTFITQYEDAVNKALTVLGPPLGLTADQQTQIRNTIIQTTDGSPTGPLTNFRCAHFHDTDPDGTNGSCQFIVRAKRINVMQDAVEAVILDDPYDYANPVYSLWLHVLERELSGAHGVYSKLCGTPISPGIGNLTNRSWNMVARAYKKFSCNAATSGTGDTCAGSDSTTHTCTDITCTDIDGNPLSSEDCCGSSSGTCP